MSIPATGIALTIRGGKYRDIPWRVILSHEDLNRIRQHLPREESLP